MPLFEKFRRWLKGCFTCSHCGKEFCLMCFGYGEAVCPDCYGGEQTFISFDGSYWLNRLMMRLLRIETPSPRLSYHDHIMIHQTSEQFELKTAE